MKRFITIWLAFPLFLSACADNSLYYWSGYEDQLYEYYSGKPPSELIEIMENIKVSSPDQDKPLPPTFYAHLGLLYQKTGQTEKFKELAREEKTKFPEGTSFINYLLKRGG